MNPQDYEWRKQQNLRIKHEFNNNLTNIDYISRFGVYFVQEESNLPFKLVFRCAFCPRRLVIPKKGLLVGTQVMVWARDHNPQHAHRSDTPSLSSEPRPLVTSSSSVRNDVDDSSVMGIGDPLTAQNSSKKRGPPSRTYERLSPATQQSINAMLGICTAPVIPREFLSRGATGVSKKQALRRSSVSVPMDVIKKSCREYHESFTGITQQS